MDKRKEPRRDYFSRVELEGTTAEGRSFRLTGMIEDRSKTGFGIRVKTPLELGCEVKLLQAGRVYWGLVRHCSRDRDSYYLGLEEIEREAAPDLNASPDEAVASESKAPPSSEESST